MAVDSSRLWAAYGKTGLTVLTSQEAGDFLLVNGWLRLGYWSWSWNLGLLTSCWSAIPAPGSLRVICSGGLVPGSTGGRRGGVAETGGQSAGLPSGPLWTCGPRTVCCPVLLKSPKSGSSCQMSSLSNVRSVQKTNHCASLVATGALGWEHFFLMLFKKQEQKTS